MCNIKQFASVPESCTVFCVSKLRSKETRNCAFSSHWRQVVCSPHPLLISLSLFLHFNEKSQLTSPTISLVSLCVHFVWLLIAQKIKRLSSPYSSRSETGSCHSQVMQQAKAGQAGVAATLKVPQAKFKADSRNVTQCLVCPSSVRCQM